MYPVESQMWQDPGDNPATFIPIANSICSRIPTFLWCCGLIRRELLGVNPIFCARVLVAFTYSTSLTFCRIESSHTSFPEATPLLKEDSEVKVNDSRLLASPWMRLWGRSTPDMSASLGLIPQKKDLSIGDFMGLGFHETYHRQGDISNRNVILGSISEPIVSGKGCLCGLLFSP